MFSLWPDEGCKPEAFLKRFTVPGKGHIDSHCQEIVIVIVIALTVVIALVIALVIAVAVAIGVVLLLIITPGEEDLDTSTPRRWACEERTSVLPQSYSRLGACSERPRL